MRNDAVDTEDIISTLPLTEECRSEFIETANRVFEATIERIEPKNVERTRALWDPAFYIDHHLMTQDMLPISRGHALSLIDAFLVHHVIALAVEADNTLKRDRSELN